MKGVVCFLSLTQFHEYSGGIERVCTILSRQLISNGYSVIFIFKNKSKQPGIIYSEDNDFIFPYDNLWDERNVQFFADVVVNNHIDFVIDSSNSYRCHEIASIVRNKYSFGLISTCHVDPFSRIRSLYDDFDQIKFLDGNFLYKSYFYIRYILKFPMGIAIRAYSLRKRLRQFYDDSDACVFLCDKSCEKVISFIGVKSNRGIVSIPNPIVFPNIDFPIKKKNQVVIVARMDFQKRIDRLLMAWKLVSGRIPDWQLKIVGDGECLGLYKSIVQKNNIKRVYFTGYIPSTAVLMESKIVAVTSSYEGFGMTILEGMSMGVVPIAFDSYDAVKQLITNGDNGFLVSPYSISKYAEKIEFLAKNEDVLQLFQKKSIQKARNFDVKLITEKWEQLFSRINESLSSNSSQCN